MRAASLRIIFYVCMSLMLTLTHEARAGGGDMQQTDRDLDNFAASLMKHIAEKYFDIKTKLVIKMAVFEFVDESGDFTVGSRYISNRIRMAFARSPQFDLLDVFSLDERVMPSARIFEEEGGQFPKSVVNDLRSDVYIGGQIKMVGPARIVCQVRVWGLSEATASYDQIQPLTIDRSELFLKMSLTRSGARFFHRKLTDQSDKLASSEKEASLGQVIFLTQPVNDDLNPW